MQIKHEIAQSELLTYFDGRGNCPGGRSNSNGSSLVDKVISVFESTKSNLSFSDDEKFSKIISQKNVELWRAESGDQRYHVITGYELGKKKVFLESVECFSRNGAKWEYSRWWNEVVYKAILDIPRPYRNDLFTYIPPSLARITTKDSNLYKKIEENVNGDKLDNVTRSISKVVNDGISKFSVSSSYLFSKLGVVEDACYKTKYVFRIMSEEFSDQEFLDIEKFSRISTFVLSKENSNYN